MGAYQVMLDQSISLNCGDVYGLPSGRFVRVLEPLANASRGGFVVEVVSVRDMEPVPHGVMVLTAPFFNFYGHLAWTAHAWRQRAIRVAAENEAVRIMREKRVIAAEQDVARALAIDAEFAAKKVAEVAERAKNRAIMRLAA
jgi:hypothetical protein